MKPVSDALEAWRQAVRDREATTPRTPEWLQAMMIEQDRRAAYQAAARDSGSDVSPSVDEPVDRGMELPPDGAAAPSPIVSNGGRPAVMRRPRLGMLRRR